jgi:integrase
MFSSENLKKMQIDMVSLINWANGYLDHAKVTVVEKTYRDEKVPAFKRLLKKLNSEMTVDKLTPHDCLKFLSKQNQDRSGNAANKDRKNLSAGWNWGVKFMNLPKDNPFMAVDPFPTEEKPRYVPPEEDFWKVFEVASYEQKILLLAFLHTSARRGELFRLHWNDIDFARNLIRLGTRKRIGGSLEYNTVSITEELKQALSEKKKSSSSVYVFCDEYGQPFKYRRHLMKRLCLKANVTAFGFHSIRHLSASILASEGTDIPNIQSQLRHKHLHTTSRYLHKLGATDNVMEKVFGDRKQTRCSI